MDFENKENSPFEKNPRKILNHETEVKLSRYHQFRSQMENQHAKLMEIHAKGNSGKLAPWELERMKPKEPYLIQGHAVHFIAAGSPVKPSQISACEAACGVDFPEPLREMYLYSNGGDPQPNGFMYEGIEILITEFFPLVSDNAKTAVDYYRDFVYDLRVVPETFFPFACSSREDYFFVDTATADGQVYVHGRQEGEPDPLGLNFDEFWDSVMSSSPNEDEE